MDIYNEVAKLLSLSIDIKNIIIKTRMLNETYEQQIALMKLREAKLWIDSEINRLDPNGTRDNNS